MPNDPLLSQQEAAAHADVATRTFRDWRIKPADYDGRKPLYRRSDVDREMARRRRQNANGGPTPNVLRGLVEQFAADAVFWVGVHWREWFEQGAWKRTGLSETQAREIAWRGFILSALAVQSYKTDKFEKRLGDDLDEIAEKLLGRPFASTWTSEDVDIPPFIAELMPPEAQR